MLGNDLIYRRRLRCFANIIRDGSDIGAAVVIEVLAELRQGMRYLEGIDLAAWRQLRSQYGIAPCACAHVENSPRRLNVFDKPPFRLKPAFPIVVRKLRVVGDQLNGRSTGNHTIDWSYYWFPDSFHWKRFQPGPEKFPGSPTSLGVALTCSPGMPPGICGSPVSVEFAAIFSESVA